MEGLDAGLRKRIIEKLKELEENPFPRGSIKLRGEKDAYRLRIGDYRILYIVLWDEGVALVFKIDHRSTVYR